MKYKTGNPKHYKFLVNTFTNWNEPPRARHQVAYALANWYPVIFISANYIGFPYLHSKQISDNLKVIIPYFPLDFRIRIRIPILNRIYQIWLFKQLKKKYNDYCVVNFDFTARYMFRYFKQVIYYCNDDHVGLSYRLNARWIAQYHEVSEKLVAKQSGFCVGTSTYLVEKLKQVNDRTFEIRLGAPSIDFNLVHFKKQYSPVIHVGFVGFLETIDKKLINFLFSSEDIHFTLIGPFKPKTRDSLKKYKNIRITGQLTGDDLYKEVSRFDVGIIPYNVNSIIDRTPNKLWLYLALGIPVVISNITGIMNWVFPEKFVYLSNNDNEFYEKIHQAYEENNSELSKKRTEFAHANSWDNRIIELLKICDMFLENSFND
jgi:glycosyltransferase involved in cell wall biosynthesis